MPSIRLDGACTRLRAEPDELRKGLMLNDLHDRNETLYHRVILDHVEEMAPLVYTPTVGRICQEFGNNFTRPRGLYFTPEDRGDMAILMRSWNRAEVSVVVATDGGRVLGLGDLGANAMGISVDDRSREWRVADAPYCRGRGDTADVDVATVEALVSERSRAKIAAEYDTADAIRDRLRTEFGVSVDDRVREWVVDSQPAAAPVEVDEPFVVVDAPAAEEPAAAAEEAPAAVQSEAELSALTVPALKDLCRAAGLKVGGKKAELVERILRGSN